MKKLIISVFATLLSLNLWAGACLHQEDDQGLSTCIEYLTDNEQVLRSFRMGCEVNPTSSWIESKCPGAQYGCKINTTPLYAMIIWFVNIESRDEVEMACQQLNGELVEN
jgi:hypothetical protein